MLNFTEWWTGITEEFPETALFFKEQFQLAWAEARTCESNTDYSDGYDAGFNVGLNIGYNVKDHEGVAKLMKDELSPEFEKWWAETRGVTNTLKDLLADDWLDGFDKGYNEGFDQGFKMHGERDEP